LSTYINYSKSESYIKEKKSSLLKRLGKTENELMAELQFHAIMLLSDGFNLEMNLQVSIASKTAPVVLQ
jgi:hypothetical protein